METTSALAWGGGGGTMHKEYLNLKTDLLPFQIFKGALCSFRDVLTRRERSSVMYNSHVGPKGKNVVVKQ